MKLTQSEIESVSRSRDRVLKTIRDNPVRVGDRVAYTRIFLESSAVERRERHAMASRRGTVTLVESNWLAHVSWEDTGTRSATINIGNLCRPRSIAFVES